MTPAPEAQAAYAELREQLTGELDKAATHAFSSVFLIAAAFALLALLPIAMSGAAQLGARRRAGPVAAGLAVGASAAVVGAYLALGGAGFQPREVADPCVPKSAEELRAQSGGLFERIGLSALDGAACRLRVTREELALAVASEAARREFVASHRITDAGLEDAVRDGARRAIADERRRGSLSPAEASLLERAVGAVPVATLLDALQSGGGRSAIDFLAGLLGSEAGEQGLCVRDRLGPGAGGRRLARAGGADGVHRAVADGRAGRRVGAADSGELTRHRGRAAVRGALCLPAWRAGRSSSSAIPTGCRQGEWRRRPMRSCA